MTKSGALRTAATYGWLATEPAEHHVHDITRAVLGTPCHSAPDEARRRHVCEILRTHSPVERDQLVAQAIEPVRKTHPEECKVFIRAALGIPIDWIAWDLDVTRETANRWKWRGRSKILQHLEQLAERERAHLKTL